jgi:hypothetical protein
MVCLLSKLTADQKLQGYNQILDGMIIEKLVNKQSADITVTKDEVDAQLAKIKAQFPSEDVFESEMKKSGLTMEQFTCKPEALHSPEHVDAGASSGKGHRDRG